MSGLWDALRRLAELLVAYLAGRMVQRAGQRADDAEARLAARRRRDEVEREVGALSDGELDRRLRDEP